MSLQPKTYEVILGDLNRLEKENQMLKQTCDDTTSKHTNLIHTLQFTQFSIDTISETIVWIDADGNFVL